MREPEPKEQVTARGRRHRAENKKKALEYLGSKCIKCGYNKCLGALDFHHLNPKEKEIAINQALSRHWSWNRLKDELDKCVILCANCHREIHC